MKKTKLFALFVVPTFLTLAALAKKPNAHRRHGGPIFAVEALVATEPNPKTSKPPHIDRSAKEGLKFTSRILFGLHLHADPLLPITLRHLCLRRKEYGDRDLPSSPLDHPRKTRYDSPRYAKSGLQNRSDRQMAPWLWVVREKLPHGMTSSNQAP